MGQYELDDIARLVVDPRESFEVEIKQWIDPTTDEGIAKIVKACLAMRNNNGGVLLIGFKRDGSPDAELPKYDLKACWHTDKIQELLSKYASEPFAVAIELVEREGTAYPVIIVPSGIRTPVACRSDLPANGHLLKCHAVYVRTLNSNKTISSSVATYKDWPRLTEFCFDNREANIGAFVRRHLSGNNMRDAIAAMGAIGVSEIGMAAESAFLDFGHKRFDEQWLERSGKPLPDIATIEISIVADGPFATIPLSNDSMWRIDSAIPRISGWSPWVGLASAPDESVRPYVMNDGWEAFISGAVLGPHLDFWRIEPTGRLYHLRMLEDDVKPRPDSPEPGTSLDYHLQIIRVAEFTAVGIRIVRALGFETEQTELSVAFRWTHLKNRKLTRWGRPASFPIRTAGICRQDNITTTTRVPLTTPDSALGPHVQTLLSPLFTLFGGFSLDERDYQKIIDDFFARRG